MLSKLIDGYCMLQKMSNGKFMSRLLKVPVTDVFKVSEGLVPLNVTIPHGEHVMPQSLTDSDDSDNEFANTNNSFIPSPDTADSRS